MLIKDLSKELDAEAMTAVHGGADDRGNSNVGGIVQLANVNAGNLISGGAGSSITSSNNVNVSQDATQIVDQNNGDFLGLFLGRFPTLRA
jgi:hypothetical protein